MSPTSSHRRCNIKNNGKIFRLKRNNVENKNQLEILLCYSNLGVCAEKYEEHDQALVFHLKALEIAKQLYGEGDDPHFAVVLNNAGIAHSNVGDYDQAHHFRSTAYEMRIRLFGENDHSDLCNSLYSMGISHHYLNEDQKAAEFFTLAVEMHKRLPEENPKLLGTLLEKLGMLWKKLNNDQLSENVFQNLLKYMRNCSRRKIRKSNG